MFALAVVLREVFPAVWTTQEVIARAEAVQEMLSRTVPLQEVRIRVLVMREVLMRAVDVWDLFPAAVATSEAIVSMDRGARGVHSRHQGPCILLPPWFRRAATHVALGAHGHCHRCQRAVGLPTVDRAGRQHGTSSSCPALSRT